MVDKESNKLAKNTELNKEQLESLSTLIHTYATYRNQAADFDALLGLISSQIDRKLTEHEKDLLLQIEYAYAMMYKPASSISIIQEIGSLYKRADNLLKTLEHLVGSSDPKSTQNYINAIRAAKDILKLVVDIQDRIFSSAVVEGLIRVVMEQGDTEIKIAVSDFLNKIRYGKE